MTSYIIYDINKNTVRKIFILHININIGILVVQTIKNKGYTSIVIIIIIIVSMKTIAMNKN